MKNDICAVVVTFNRKELLLRNLKSLLQQNVNLDILVYDNASTDNTYEYLQQNGIFSYSNIDYFRGNENAGGAGGFSYGSKLAVDKGYKYIWLMDDDGYCINEETLSHLLEVAKEKIIVNSYVTYDKDSLEPTFKIMNATSYLELQRYIDGNLIIGSGSPYNGTLVPRECFIECGYPQARFFIYGDEYEFFLRTKKYGYNWITNVQSLYFHPVNRKVIKTLEIFGKKIECLEQPIWKFYLDIRNTEYIKKHYYINRNSIASYFKVILLSIMAKDKTIKRIYYGFLAVHDGKNEKFDRSIMFK